MNSEYIFSTGSAAGDNSISELIIPTLKTTAVNYPLYSTLSFLLHRPEAPVSLSLPLGEALFKLPVTLELPLITWTNHQLLNSTEMVHANELPK